MTDPLLTVRAAIRDYVRGYQMLSVNGTKSEDDYIDGLLATLSDPAVMDELARWLVEQEEGPFYPYAKQCLRQRTRSEPT